MGKRGYNGNNGNKRKKYKVSTGILDPGVAGVYATCPRNKEPKCIAELMELFGEKIEEYGIKADPELQRVDPNAPKKNQQEEKTEGAKSEAPKETKELSIEDSIKAELEELEASKKKPLGKKGGNNNKGYDEHELLKPLTLDQECLVFIKFKKPIDPEKFVHQVLEDLYEGRTPKRTKFVLKLMPVQASCNATLEELSKLAAKVLKRHFHNGQLVVPKNVGDAEDSTKEEIGSKNENGDPKPAGETEDTAQQKKGGNVSAESDPDGDAMREKEATVNGALHVQPVYTFAINVSRRNFNTIPKDALIKKIAETMGHEYGHRVDLKNYDKLIMVECFKNNIGISVVDDYNKFSRYNVDQMYVKSISSEGAATDSRVGGAEKSEQSEKKENTVEDKNGQQSEEAPSTGEEAGEDKQAEESPNGGNGDGGQGIQLFG